ncbi:hypothetical protein ASC90_27035 [Rhizobium sp. Root1220]|nr:hypothetical protein ASC90_27035 [Rhizobium sp. Root1220]
MDLNITGRSLQPEEKTLRNDIVLLVAASGGTGNATSARVLEGLDPPRKRPDYYLVCVGDGPVFDYVNPTTVHDILWSWS